MRTFFYLLPCLFFYQIVKSQQCENIFGKDEPTFEISNSNFSGKPEHVEMLKSDLVYLDFDNNTDCIISEDKKRQLLSADFSVIKSKFNRKGFSIFIDIRRKAYEFYFDINYNEAFTMPMDKNIAFLKESHQTEIGETTNFIYNNTWITVNGINYSSAITISPGEEKPKLGIGFIKGFNWIIDRKNEKIYIKKNNIPIDKENPYTKAYKAQVINGQLKIISRNERFVKFTVGDIISSVNGIKVTPKNSYDMAAVLGNTADWKFVAIEILPPLPK